MESTVEAFVEISLDSSPDPAIGDALSGIATSGIVAAFARKAKQIKHRRVKGEPENAERTAELARLNADLERRVTELTHQRDAALAHADEIRKTDSPGRLAASTAHDFNNLLMAVLGNLDLLRQQIADNPVACSRIDRAIHGVERGAAMFEALLQAGNGAGLGQHSINSMLTPSGAAT